MFDFNLAYGLPTPLGNLDISAALSFRRGRYQELANIYSVATSLAKLHSSSSVSYTIIINHEVDTLLALTSRCLVLMYEVAICHPST
jgi:hypothetical protein